MLTPNPTNDRLKFIYKTYGEKKPIIVRDMVSVVANTVGVDRWLEEIQERIQTVDPKFVADLHKWGPSSLTNIPGLNNPPPEFVLALVDMVSAMPQFKTRHRADPLFPWMATQLAKAYEPIAKIVAAARDPSLQHDLIEERGAAAPADHYRDVLRKMRRGGTMLAQWYEAKRPNLGQYGFKQAWDEASRWHEEEGPIPQGEVVVELEDGWTAQKLTTAEQLDAEGEKMQHCVGSYADEVKSGGTTIYSLRDEKGQPHVTIEVKNDRVRQAQGKQNNKPAAKYQKYVTEFNGWLEEQGIPLSKVPPALQEYADAIEEHGNFDGGDDDDDYLADYAREWDNNVATAEVAAEWMKSGLMYNEAELAGALGSEDVTPEEYGKFPFAVYREISSQGGVPHKIDEMIAIARMTMKLRELLPQRDPPLPPSKQIDLFERESTVPKRQPGQDPQGMVKLKHRWDKEGASHLGWKSNLLGEWSEAREAHDDDENEWLYPENEWLYPAEEWLASKYSPDPDDDAYVGPWFIHRFTPEQADEWWDVGFDDAVGGDQAAELRSRRVTPKMLEELEEAEGYRTHPMIKTSTLGWRDTNDHVWDMSVDDIVDVLDAFLESRGMRRNPGKRTSRPSQRRRTSRPRR